MLSLLCEKRGGSPLQRDQQLLLHAKEKDAENYSKQGIHSKFPWQFSWSEDSVTFLNYYSSVVDPQHMKEKEEAIANEVYNWIRDEPFDFAEGEEKNGKKEELKEQHGRHGNQIPDKLSFRSWLNSQPGSSSSPGFASFHQDNNSNSGRGSHIPSCSVVPMDEVPSVPRGAHNRNRSKLLPTSCRHDSFESATATAMPISTSAKTVIPSSVHQDASTPKKQIMSGSSVNNKNNSYDLQWDNKGYCSDSLDEPQMLAFQQTHDPVDVTGRVKSLEITNSQSKNNHSLCVDFSTANVRILKKRRNSFRYRRTYNSTKPEDLLRCLQAPKNSACFSSGGTSCSRTTQNLQKIQSQHEANESRNPLRKMQDLSRKKEAEANLPELTAREGIHINMRDMHSPRWWKFKYKFWPNNKSRMYVLENTGDFVKAHGLNLGDFIMLYREEDTDTYVVRAKKMKDRRLSIECEFQDLDNRQCKEEIRSSVDETRKKHEKENDDQIAVAEAETAEGEKEDTWISISALQDFFPEDFDQHFKPNTLQLNPISNFGFTF